MNETELEMLALRGFAKAMRMTEKAVFGDALIEGHSWELVHGTRIDETNEEEYDGLE